MRPDAIIVDHLAFSARLALQTGGIPYADVVLGHPSALPVRARSTATRRSGRPRSHPTPDELAELRALCDKVSARFTAEWNRAALALSPSAPLTDDAFAEHGDLVLYNYPAAAGGGDGRGRCRRTRSSAPLAATRRRR